MNKYNLFNPITLCCFGFVKWCFRLTFELEGVEWYKKFKPQSETCLTCKKKLRIKKTIIIHF